VGDLLGELGCLGGGGSDDRLDLDPLGELVDCNLDVGEATYGGLEGSGRVESLASEGP
jgi:hypothetical protein